MSKISPSSEVSALLQSVAGDLAEPVDKNDAKNIVSAVRKLPEDPTVTLGAIEQLGFTPALRARLVFELFARQHLELVRPNLRASPELSGVFRALSGQDPTTEEWDEDAEIDEELAHFVESLLVKDAEDVNTGSNQLEVARYTLGKVEGAIHLTADKTPLVLSETDSEGIKTWRYRLGDAEESEPITALTLRSLEGLFDFLSQNASRGASNPLLEMMRSELDQREGGVLENVVSALEVLIEKKRAARREHLAGVDRGLRLALGDRAVGRAPQSEVVELAERALGGQQG